MLPRNEEPMPSNPFSRIPTRITSDFVGIRQNMAGIRSGCMQFRSYPTIGIRLKGFRQLTAEIRPRLFGSDGIRLGIIDLGAQEIHIVAINGQYSMYAS
jgi:hypothetical protein